MTLTNTVCLPLMQSLDNNDLQCYTILYFVLDKVPTFRHKKYLSEKCDSEIPN